MLRLNIVRSVVYNMSQYYSNTTNVKVKQISLHRLNHRNHIQIQPMLRLNL